MGAFTADADSRTDDDPLEGLNYRQQKFVLAYVETGNATLSAERAGYEPTVRNSLEVQGHRLTRHAKCASAIARLTAERTPDIDSVLLGLSRQCVASMRDVCVQDADGNWEFSLTAAIERGTDGLIRKMVPTRHGYAVELHDPQRAAELILRARGAFMDRLRISVEDVGTLSDDQLAALAAGKPL